MAPFIASIAVSTLFALSSVVGVHAGASLGGAPTIGLTEAGALVAIGAVALMWRLFSRSA